MQCDSSSVRDRFRMPAHATVGRAPRWERGAEMLRAAKVRSQIPARAATRAAAAGARTGIGVASVVAAWVGLRLALGGSLLPEVRPLADALAWSRELSGSSKGEAGWGPTAAPSMTLLASHLAVAAIVGALACAATAAVGLRPRVTLLLACSAPSVRCGSSPPGMPGRGCVLRSGTTPSPRCSRCSLCSSASSSRCHSFTIVLLRRDAVPHHPPADDVQTPRWPY